MKILDLYRAILKTANLVADDVGYVSLQQAGERTPVMVSGKRLVLPTREHLQNPKWDDRVAFHPLSENILRGESEVLAKFRQALNLRLNFVFGVVAYQLLQLGTSPAEHNKLNPDQSEYLSRVKNADDKTLHVLERLIDQMPVTQTQRAFVSIYLKRSGTVDGRRYARVGVVSFPLYNDLKEATTECYGVKMRVKDREALLALMEYMIPGIDHPERHHRGSESAVAPYLDALMKAVMVVAGPLNDLIELFRNVLEAPDELRFEDSWVESFDNLAPLLPEIRSIPMQAGNEGAPVGQGTTVTQPQPAQPTLAATPQQQVAATATPPTAPAQPYPPQYPQAMGYPQQPPPPPPAPVSTGRGLDFESLVRSNPALQMATAGYGQAGYNPQLGPQQRIPRWAQPQFGAAPAPGYPPPPGYGPGYGQGGYGGGGFGRM